MIVWEWNLCWYTLTCLNTILEILRHFEKHHALHLMLKFPRRLIVDNFFSYNNCKSFQFFFSVLPLHTTKIGPTNPTTGASKLTTVYKGMYERILVFNTFSQIFQQLGQGITFGFCSKKQVATYKPRMCYVANCSFLPNMCSYHFCLLLQGTQNPTSEDCKFLHYSLHQIQNYLYMDIRWVSRLTVGVNPLKQTCAH